MPGEIQKKFPGLIHRFPGLFSASSISRTCANPVEYTGILLNLLEYTGILISTYFILPVDISDTKFLTIYTRKYFKVKTMHNTLSRSINHLEVDGFQLLDLPFKKWLVYVSLICFSSIVWLNFSMIN